MKDDWWALGIIVCFFVFGIFGGLAISTLWPEGLGVCP